MPDSVRFIRFEETLLAGPITETFNLTLDPENPPNNVIEYFVFVDANGDVVDVTGDGTVAVTISSGEDIYQTLTNGTFNASDGNSGNRGKPNGYGRAEKIRIAFTGTITGAVGFRSMIRQYA